MEKTVAACGTCGLVQRIEALEPGATAECCRCGAILRRRKIDSLRRTAALSLAALIFYAPANIYPILSIELYGAYSENTVWDGCVALFRDGQWLVAIIVFLASILIPLFKLLGLFYLTVTAKFNSPRRRLERTWIYRVIGVIGPWAMLDVFLLSILVALVKLGQIATILPGTGLLAFSALVVLTILASSSFDPIAIWDESDMHLNHGDHGETKHPGNIEHSPDE
ncbi:MAG: paraquat-inducible protein A [Sulfuricella sp.]|nr:paraquat-inducible protein A [Sulfuricella sp.]